MARLWGREWTREELEQRVGDVLQIGGVRLVELADGKERGVRAAEFRTGSGLAFTTGMESLGHKEFEIRRTHRPPEEVVEMLLDLCLYVLKRGPILLHGQTFGRTAEERMKIRHGPSMHSGRGKIITLEM